MGDSGELGESDGQGSSTRGRERGNVQGAEHGRGAQDAVRAEGEHHGDPARGATAGKTWGAQASGQVRASGVKGSALPWPWKRLE
jgi:hypothetical protein